MRVNDFAQGVHLLDNVLLEGRVVNDVHRARMASERDSQVVDDSREHVIGERIEKVDDQRIRRKLEFASVEADRMRVDPAAVFPEPGEVFLGDGMKLGLHLHANDVLERVRSGQQQRSSLPRAKVDEGERREVDSRQLLKDFGEFSRNRWLIKTLGKNLAQTDAPTQASPGGIEAVIAIVVDVAKAAAPALGMLSRNRLQPCAAR